MQVTIASSLYYGKEITGTFEYVGVTEGDKYCIREVYLRIMKDGKAVNVHANRADFTVDGMTQVAQAAMMVAAPVLTDAELGEVIRDRFDIMDAMTEGVVTGNVRSLIISGAPGVGKTFNLERRLTSALAKQEVKKMTHIKGKISPLALYMELYKHHKEGQVILFDDVDSVFGEETSLNMLKGALDTGTRILSWLSNTRFLEDEDIPNTFQFEGACVFITNVDFDAKIEKNTADSAHYKALISRSNYLDLKVHTNREVLIRVKQIVEDTNIIADQGLTVDQGKAIIEWLDGNFENMREISVRTILKISNYMKTDTKDWKKMASVMLLRR